MTKKFLRKSRKKIKTKSRLNKFKLKVIPNN